jgi:hypothetical protein
MKTKLEVKELIGKLNSSSDPVDQKCAETLQHVLDEIDSAMNPETYNRRPELGLEVLLLLILKLWRCGIA